VESEQRVPPSRRRRRAKDALLACGDTHQPEGGKNGKKRGGYRCVTNQLIKKIQAGTLRLWPGRYHPSQNVKDGGEYLGGDVRET